MGGDGLYCECMNGLLIRTQTDAGRDYDDPEVLLRRPSLPIGIIPAGESLLLKQTRITIQATHFTRQQS